MELFTCRLFFYQEKIICFFVFYQSACAVPVLTSTRVSFMKFAPVCRQYSPTVGVEFYLKRTVLPGPRNVALKVRVARRWGGGGEGHGAIFIAVAGAQVVVAATQDVVVAARTAVVAAHEYMSNNPHYKLWDVGGSALDGRMLDKYVYGANAVLLVYDVSNHNSFENLEGWLMACKKVRVEWTLK